MFHALLCAATNMDRFSHRKQDPINHREYFNGNFTFAKRAFILLDMVADNIDFEEALSTLGELLASRGATIDIVAVGGGALSLLGLISRATKDIDIVALMREGRLVSATTLPPELEQARNDVASVLGLPVDWLNAGPTQLLDFGLPDGFDPKGALLVA